MCGILVCKTDNLNNSVKSRFKYALEGLKTRGPDETRMIQNKNLLVGFTRLSINNIKNGSQPFKSLCGKYIIVFNGEIVNYKDLAQSISEKNVKMRYGHEAEVIINLFILYGDKCVTFLRGFFAFVIIEIKSNNIFLAVDRFSIKPLYYYQEKKNNLIIIASDFSVLIKNNLVKQELNLSKILDYFSLARELDNSTIFQNIKKLKASSIAKIKKGKLQTFQYWHPFKNNLTFENNKNISFLIQNKLSEVINLWKIAETKISLCLSTGVDSQILNHFFYKNKVDMSRFFLKESEKKFFKFDKTIKIKPDSKKVLSLFNKFARNTYNPFPLVHSSSTSLFQLYNEIKRKNFKFTFTGEGSDEIFGGYERYKRQLYLIKNKKLNFIQMIMEMYKHEINILKKNFHKHIMLDFQKKLVNKISNVEFHSKKIENKILEFDQICWIPVVIQRHDFIGMNYSLEVRPPYLDHELVELINSVPTNLKYNLFNTKIILRKILEKNFNYRPTKFKIGTPSLFEKIMQNKKEVSNFKEIIFYGEFKKILNTEKIIKKIKKNFDKQDSIFLWRLYTINKILYKF